MKQIIYPIFTLLILLFCACNEEDIPGASFDRMEAAGLNAVAGDEEVILSWEALEGSNPIGYYLSWTASSLTVGGGEKTVEESVKTATITGLVNGETYTFSVQPVYPKGRGGKISVTAKPVSTKIAATHLIAAAGDQKIRLRWTKPNSDNLTEYKLLVSSLSDPIIIPKDKESYEVTGLTNDTEYEFLLIYVYPNGTSDAIQAKATPGQVYSIIVPNGTSSAVAVDASDHVYIGTNSAIYKLDASGNEVWKTSRTINVTERGAFAMDNSGTTLYATLKGSAGLMALDMSTGNSRWTYANTGGGDAYLPITGPDGTIYFNDKGGKKIYAVHSNGSLKWEKEAGAALTYCGLVLADNGKVYCATQGKVGSAYVIYGLNASTGNVDYRYESEQQFMASASIGPDKRLYIGTIGSENVGSLLALPIEAGLETSSWSVRGGNMWGTNRK